MTRQTVRRICWDAFCEDFYVLIVNDFIVEAEYMGKTWKSDKKKGARF
jgi:hypothetical protein